VGHPGDDETEAGPRVEPPAAPACCPGALAIHRVPIPGSFSRGLSGCLRRSSHQASARYLGRPGSRPVEIDGARAPQASS
jgi:hypothetical protein